jgi:hypothetical protein
MSDKNNNRFTQKQLSAATELLHTGVIVSASRLQRDLKISRQAATELLSHFEQSGCLITVKKGFFRFQNNDNSRVVGPEAVRESDQLVTAMLEIEGPVAAINAYFAIDTFWPDFSEASYAKLSENLTRYAESTMSEMSNIVEKANDNKCKLEKLSDDIANAKASTSAQMVGLREKLETLKTHHGFAEVVEGYFENLHGFATKTREVEAESQKLVESYKQSLRPRCKQMQKNVVLAESIRRGLAASVAAARDFVESNRGQIDIEKQLRVRSAVVAVIITTLTLSFLYFCLPAIKHTFEYVMDHGLKSMLIYTSLAIGFAILMIWLARSANDDDAGKLLLGTLFPIGWLLYAYFGFGLVIGAAAGGFFLWRWAKNKLTTQATNKRQAVETELEAIAHRLAAATDSGKLADRQATNEASVSTVAKCQALLGNYQQIETAALDIARKNANTVKTIRELHEHASADYRKNFDKAFYAADVPT